MLETSQDMEGCSPCGETTQAPPRGEGADGTGATVSKLEICGRCRAGTEGEGGGAAGTAKACGCSRGVLCDLTGSCMDPDLDCSGLPAEADRVKD
mmetsp:Transcript_55045/g.120421  ORF Transcript_55045/g.120421 Transcript_55045/m.120421 type:complete len:95 (+) Transcript_55045:330-614(+)